MDSELRFLDKKGVGKLGLPKSFREKKSRVVSKFWLESSVPSAGPKMVMGPGGCQEGVQGAAGAAPSGSRLASAASSIVMVSPHPEREPWLICLTSGIEP